jgi:uncharacterized protein involved in exopolysaccharide biosynthesis
MRQSGPERTTAIPAVPNAQAVVAALLPALTLPKTPQLVMAAWVIGLGAGCYLMVLWMVSYRFHYWHAISHGVAL